MTPVVEIQQSRAAGDCAIVALAMYLGVPYEDVLAAAVKLTHRNAHRGGLYTYEIRRIAERLGVTLRLRRKVDVERDEGLLGFRHETQGDHVALLKRGMVFDVDGKVWEPEAFYIHSGYRPVSLLVKAAGE